MKGFKADFVDRLPEFGFSSIANIIASIKLAKKMKLTKNDAIITVATDGADLYETELAKTKKQFSKIYDQVTCAEIFAKNLRDLSFLSDRDWKTYENLFKILCIFFPALRANNLHFSTLDVETLNCP